MTQPIDPLRLEKAQSGDEAALATLIARFMPTIRSLAKRAESPGLDFDDAVQEAYIGLFHAVKTYDPAKGTAFATYATTCIRNSIVTAMRAAGRKKHAPLNSSVPLRESATVPGPEELAILKEQYREAVRGINTKLSGFEKEALLLSLRGQSYSEIAKALSRTPKAVDNALVRVRQKLKPHT
ncbi:MAG: sigma-70 family RNA polymerase sigma factor [Pygmaiobacter massiliensis]|uniref:sigma-70 family RNA polymerase sigma factor n=1 Tax=Pygmaiobacter massiliensis TaxID=1917873 RepID=UPI00289837A4|nr:sigma-70 family RNA polymerase sigma factor [Pygmaiobacter massiliensis]